jgi:hypothetical protein
MERKRRLVIPLVLTVSLAGAAATTSGCRTDHKPVVDGGIARDGVVDTPVV